MIFVVSFAGVYGSREVESEFVVHIHYQTRIYHHKCCVALVALSVKIERVYCLEVFVLIALPCEDAIVVGIENKRTYAAKREYGLCLCAESAAKVVVAVDDVVVVAERTAKENTAKEDALL